MATIHASRTVQASIEHPELIRQAILVVKAAGAEVLEIPFRRSTSGPYAAVIPAEKVGTPGFAYCIEFELLDGTRAAVFATREEMHEVQVAEDIDTTYERATLARLDGRRSVVFTSGEYVYFGQTPAQVNTTATGLVPTTGAAPMTETRQIRDQYYRLEAGYTYRLLGVVSEFGIRGGVVRGRSVVPGQRDPSKFDVGLNYGSPTVRLKAADWFHVEGEFLTSVTEIGFSVGGGLAAIVGDPYGGKLTLGFESIQTFGTRFFSRFDLRVGSLVGVAPIIEVTDMPHSENYGVRLLTEVSLPLGQGFVGSIRGGYQARNATSGGLSGGASLAYAF